MWITLDPWYLFKGQQAAEDPKNITGPTNCGRMTFPNISIFRYAIGVLLPKPRRAGRQAE
jgi:hypothetical protein